MSIEVIRTDISLKADIKRVLLRPFEPTTENRCFKIVRRIMSLNDDTVMQELNSLLNEFGQRHRNLKQFLLESYERHKRYLPENTVADEKRQLLIGGYFSLEYSLEAAALFNPSMIWHPDQSSLDYGNRRFILSLRATGEGHISSIEFRSGTVDENYTIRLDPVSPFVSTAATVAMPEGYTAYFKSDYPLTERVLFPSLRQESNGMEDARFLTFTHENGETSCYATYTAYDGKHIYTMLLETKDFITFTIRKLRGRAVQNKGFALFPRKIKDKYVMLSRQDNENNYVMFSDRLEEWNDSLVIMEPAYPWDFFQIGNCGCPLETEAGWLVLSHGVGALRKYVISAFLLDLDEPSRVIGRLAFPLLMANEQEREGYVPNVVYTCGGQIFRDFLIFPYARSDYASGFARVNLESLLKELNSGS